MAGYLLLLLLTFAGTATAQFRQSSASPLTSGDVPGAVSPLVQEYAFISGIHAPTQNPDLARLWSKQPVEDVPGKKSPYLAAGLSLLVPGLGEYYVGDQIWRGMIFTGLEVGLWLERNHYLNRETDSMNAFYAFTDAHWHRAKYGAFMDSIIATDTSIHGIKATDPNDRGSINQHEAILDSLTTFYSDPTIKNWTHRLDVFGDQQYYELVSKYLQYVPGWDQADQFNTAAVMRANMNDQDGYASLFLYGIIANHILSAIDAAILAVDHNSRLHLHGDLIRRPYPGGVFGYAPQASLELKF